MDGLSLDFGNLGALYASKQIMPAEVVRLVHERIAAIGVRPIWITLPPLEWTLERAEAIASRNPTSMPLFGLPFAVKDNIDVAGLPTTAGCPAYAYTPNESATVVERLESAGAILIGKTNMDQFATGLVGTRSPYGACSSVFNEHYISGGSSSGSAVAVALGLVSFALGTDTAGSGRVPAAFNNLMGLKPSRGLISTSGVVPACRSLDCVSIFALTAADAAEVLDATQAFDPTDPYSREVREDDCAAPWAAGGLRAGVPAADQLQFFGDNEAKALFEKVVDAARELGIEVIEIDFAPFRAVADLLYAGPWVAERLAAIRPFIETHESEMHPVVVGIIKSAARYSAVDAFEAEYKLEMLRKQTDETWQQVDALLLPTTGTIYSIEEVLADPVKLNTNLGYYTNFVNLLDLAAVALPAGFRPNGLPFGVSLIAPAFSDRGLLIWAARLHRSLGSKLGGTKWGLSVTPAMCLDGAGPGCTLLAVVGAHLSDQPLNMQLIERGGRLVRTAKSDSAYRLYELFETVPPKPGLFYEPGFVGPGIEVEVWGVPTREFGSFVAQVPPPLGIGTVRLSDGTAVKGFVCEPFALGAAREITHYGGWRNYLAAKA